MEDGETLWGIARRYDTTVDAVRTANDLAEDAAIQPGQTLRIPRTSSSASSSTAAAPRTAPARPSTSAGRPAAERTGTASSTRPSTAAPSSSRPAAARKREHTVGDGETLWGIARKYDTTVENLRRANSLDEDDQIRPGQKLRIPD